MSIQNEVPKIFVRFEYGQQDRISADYGPFPFVQLTYDALRVGPNGDELASFDGHNGTWFILPELSEWSDIIIYSV